MNIDAARQAGRESDQRLPKGGECLCGYIREKVESGLEKRAETDPADPEEKTAGSGSDGTPTPENGPQ